MNKPPRRTGNRPITTRSGKVLKVNRSLGERYNAMRQAKSLRRVNRLRGLPKSRIKRLAWRLHPRRLAAYWFSRDGAITALKVVGIAIVAMFLLTLGVFAYFRKDIKDVTDVSGSNLGGSVSYYDRTGQTLLWQDYNAVKRVPVSSQNISPYLKQATIAVEDKNFYSERGFDLKGIVRAAYVDILKRGSTQGGSTITQQLVKLTQDFNQNRNLALKIKELILAVELERTYTKDQILTSYLNVVPYGGVDYGAQTAASDYFHESAKDLTLAQAAFLASIPKSPSLYSPYNTAYFDKDALLARYSYVLDQMTSQGKITKAQAQAAKKVDVLAQVQPQQTKYAGIKAPYFVLAARDELNKRFASQSAKVGGWKVITTLDTTLQTKAEQTVANNLPNVQRYGGDEEALVLEDVKTGQMQALVGGTDFNNADHGELNYAHSVNISPGSSFKPYDYVTLINNNTNVGAGSVLYDSTGPIPGYSCTTGSSATGNCAHDYDFKSPGPETLRYALGGSRNIPAIKAMVEAVPNDTSSGRTTSINKVINTANSLMDASDAYHCYNPGVDVSQAKVADETQCFSSSAIGDGAYLHLDQHVNGVASLARMGTSLPSTYILSIQNAANKTFYQFKQPKGTQVVRPDAAYIVDSMTSDPNASYLVGSGKWQHYHGWNTSVKTGTTNDSFDGLMMGWNTQYAVGSWVGYHTRNKALTTFMENLTLPLTRTMMEYALDNLNTTPVNYTQPSDIQTLPAYVMHSKISSNGEIVPSPTTDVYPSWYKQRSVSSASIVIDRVSGKIATSCTPDSAKQQLGGNSAPNAFSVDEFYPPNQTSSPSSSTGATGSGATDDVHKCGANPPTINITAGDCTDSCSISATPFDGTNADGSDRPLNDPAYPQFPGTVTIAVNGTAICTSTNISSGVPISCAYSPSFSGSGTITATVTDGLLYQGSDSKTVNFTQAVVGPQNLQATVTGTGVNKKTTFTWTGNNNGPYTVITSGGIPVGGNCVATSSTTCFVTGLPSGTYYVEDKDSNKSNSATT